MKAPHLIPAPGKPFRFSAHKPDDTFSIGKELAEKSLSEHEKRLPHLHDLLYAVHKRAVLV